MSNRTSQGAQNIRNSLRKRITSFEDFLAEQDRDLLSSVREGYYDGPNLADFDELISGLRNLSTTPGEPIYENLRRLLEQLSRVLNDRWEKTKEAAVKGSEAAQKVATALDKYYKRRDVLKVEIESYIKSNNSTATMDIVNEKRAELNRLEKLIGELEGHREQFADILENSPRPLGGSSRRG